MIDDGALRIVTDKEAEGLCASSIIYEDDTACADEQKEEASVGKHKKRKDSLFW